MRLLSPIPQTHLSEAARIWWHSFGPRHRRDRVPHICPAHGIAAIDAQDRVAGVMGLRDSEGGFLLAPPLSLRWLYRAAPPTADLVIDGIVARQRRAGTGRALLAEAGRRARACGRPGLRAEVLARNTAAIAFYRALGFSELTRGRYGRIWSGQVVIMRRPV
ncbi:GNAT family N-acetyltransferase [Paracoccus fistulariae]|uniref:GNAT family N-acetyltransferase n=1 Tax=Paracoccus fistulariae TaxID=658446 RepID=A0ABY7SHV9_9RHOB|nr:GNAT family N-acetyltransferase [Paracoccus fistulariae]MDB6182175.1 GNAT family N-acetyltransferase [Paracoccus fistulariae]WCR06602.1 GNAT family N-acetyltransferase [Paracoccus fistulariae]